MRIETTFDALSHLMVDGIALVDANGTVGAWNEAAAAITGITAADAADRSFERLFSRLEPPLAFAPVPQQHVAWNRDESRRRLHFTALSIDDGWIVSFGPEQRFAAIEQLKSEIVASVSHELKTPVATIKAFATTLRANPDALANDRDRYLQTIEEEADRLALAIDDLLAAARVDPEHLLTKRERVPLEEVLERACERLGPTASARIDRGSLDVDLDGDAALLSDALAHLLENALKFSADSAPVTIDAERDGAGVHVRVTDRGIGVADEHVPYIFERFYRVERNLTASTSGAGLGLFLVDAIVRAHGGAVEVKSTPGSGSTFTLTLPVNE